MSGDRAVLSEMSGAERVFLPLFVIAELHFGFRSGQRWRDNVDELKRFLRKPTVIEWLPTTDTAEIYGEVQDRLKRAGTPIPINDVWIASSCIETGSKLISYDKHFRDVLGLRVWDKIADG